MNEGRFELKYALPLSRRAAVLEEAWENVQADANGDEIAPLLPPEVLQDGPDPRGYRVCSLYLDTLDLRGYTERLAEARIRNRVRVRTYGLPGQVAPVFLEAKRKLHRNVVKHRIVTGNTEQWAQGDAVRPWRDAVRDHGDPRGFARRWLDAVDAVDMRAICHVTYVRETWVQGTSRLTIDHDLRAHAWPDPRQLQAHAETPLLPPGWIVLELKFNGAEPAWMRRLVQRLQLMSEPVSKFALGVVRTVRDGPEIELRRVTPPSLVRALREAS